MSADLDCARDALQACDPPCDRDQWLRLAMAAKAAGIDLATFDAWSATAPSYSERDALGLLTGAGSLGILLPPCLPVILYANVARVGIKEMFLGGLVPGLLLIGLTVAWGVRAGRRAAAPVTPFDLGATIYQSLGIDPEREIRDPQNRPTRVCAGKPMEVLFRNR